LITKRSNIESNLNNLNKTFKITQKNKNRNEKEFLKKKYLIKNSYENLLFYYGLSGFGNLK